MRYHLLLALAWFIAFAAVVIQNTPSAHADPADRYTAVYGPHLCEGLDRSPSFVTITRIGAGIANDGLGAQSGRILVDSIVGLCPRHLPLLVAFATVYPNSMAAGRIGGVIS